MRTTRRSTPHIVDLGDPARAAAFKAIWPIGRFPVLRDDARDRTVPESSIIIEYLSQHYPGQSAARAGRRRARLRDAAARPLLRPLRRTSRCRRSSATGCRPAEAKDPLGVEQARARLQAAYGIIDAEMAKRTWAIGDDLHAWRTARAAPALFYANLAVPFGEHRNVAAYFDRLSERPSFARVRQEAEPYFGLFPKA